MNTNEALIHKFYSSFQELDWKGMTDCYHENVVFYDPVFENQEGDRARGMWEMLCGRARDWNLNFSGVRADEEYGSCHWQATYTFTPTGRKVVNEVSARFRFAEGKILEHQDDFDIWKWSRQALGTPGFLLGWTSSVKNKIRTNAKKGLDLFMTSK